MEERTGTKEISLEQGKKFIGLKSTSYKDYLAARHLLNDNFLHQAAFFMNTCIEKEIKAYLFAMGVRVTIQHDIFKLYNLLKNHNPKVGDQLNPDFIKIVSKIYASRYYEDLGAGYNFVIIRNKFLAEFDCTFSILEPITRFKLRTDKKEPTTNYEKDIAEKNSVLFRNNYLLNHIAKAEFLNRPDLVYEYRVVFNHEIIEVLYSIPFNREHNKFIFEGLKPLNDNMSFQLSNHHPATELF
jgi:HEPN domain-containing protein